VLRQEARVALLRARGCVRGRASRPLALGLVRRIMLVRPKHLREGGNQDRGLPAFSGG
jgi:hypothetical protein